MGALLEASLDTVTLDGARVLCGDALRAIVAERMKQVDRHGRTLARDQETNAAYDLPLAAASYVDAAIEQLARGANLSALVQIDPDRWPWDARWWRPEDPRTNLVKAAALLWAAIDWLDNGAGGRAEALA